MAAVRGQLVDEIAARDGYSTLYRHLLSVRPEPEWLTTFGEFEAILGGRLPDSPRLRRPLWPSSKVGIAHGYSLVRPVVGWRAREVDIEVKTTVSVRRETWPEPAETPPRRQRFSIREILPPHDPGAWPQGFTASREQIYDDTGRLSGGS